MRLHFQLLTAASVLALGLGLTAANAESAAPGTAFLNAQNIPNTETVPDTDLAPGAYSDIIRVVDTVPSTGGVEKSAGGEGADNMNSAGQPASGAGSMSQGGPHSEDQGGTGVEDSAQGEGATAKQGKPDMKEGKLPSETSTY